MISIHCYCDDIVITFESEAERDIVFWFLLFLAYYA